METWKERFSSEFTNLKFKLRRVQPIEFGVAFVLFLVGVILAYNRFNDDGNDLYFLYLLILIGVIFGAFVWIKAINRYFAKFTFYLVEHKHSRRIIAGGSYSYYGYKDPEETTTKGQILDPLSQLFTLLLAFVGISVFIMGFMSESNRENPLVWGGLAILVPLISTPLIPVLWALQTTNVKAYASGNKTTWMVGKRYKARFNSIISVAAIYSNMKDADAGDLVDQLKVLWDVVQTGVLVLLIPTSLFIIIYYGWFREELSGKLIDSLSLKTYDIVLEEHETPKYVSSNDKQEEKPAKKMEEEPVEEETAEEEEDKEIDEEE